MMIVFPYGTVSLLEQLAMLYKSGMPIYSNTISISWGSIQPCCNYHSKDLPPFTQ